MCNYVNLNIKNYEVNLNERPETFKTILKSNFGNNTETTKLRKKFSSLLRFNFITSIPIKNSIKNSYNGRDNLYYVIEKDYYIIFANNDCYYCKKINYDKNNIYVKELYILNNNKWIKDKRTKFNHSEVSLCL